MCLVVLLQTPAAVKTLPRRLLSRDHLYLFFTAGNRLAPVARAGLAAYEEHLGLTC
jgi:hypothetical protein